MRKTINRLLVLCFAVTVMLALSSYTHHSSIGMDHDFEKPGRILHKYYRINLTGYGAILIGHGSQWRQHDSGKALEKFDLASSFLKPAETPAKRDTFWKGLGFWFVQSGSPAPMLWIGIPSWLPVLVLSILLFMYYKKRRK
jgi:hypothetical protein